MARRYEVTDAEWEKLSPYLGNNQKKMGRPQTDRVEKPGERAGKVICVNC